MIFYEKKPENLNLAKNSASSDSRTERFRRKDAANKLAFDCDGSQQRSRQVMEDHQLD